MGGWEQNAPRLVAKMRTAMAADMADPGWQRLLELLEEYSPEFRELWRRQDVSAIDNMQKVLHHDEVGTLHTEVVHTWLTGQRNTRLTVYTPSDEATAAAYHRLLAVTPRRLRLPGLPAAPTGALVEAA